MALQRGRVVTRVERAGQRRQFGNADELSNTHECECCFYESWMCPFECSGRAPVSRPASFGLSRPRSIRAAAFAHGQNFDIPAVAGSGQQFQHVFEHRKTLRGFRQIFGMKAIVKDPSKAGGGLQPAPETLDAGAQTDHPAFATPRSGRGRPRRECSKAPAASLAATPAAAPTRRTSSRQPRQLPAERRPELEGASHRTAAIAADAVRGQQCRGRPPVRVRTKTRGAAPTPSSNALTPSASSHRSDSRVARAIGPDEMSQTSVKADLLEGTRRAQTFHKGMAIPEGLSRPRRRSGSWPSSPRAVRPFGGRARPRCRGAPCRPP